MPDLEKVICGLECCTKENINCMNCPYCNDDSVQASLCDHAMMEDALALLMEQEPTKPYAQGDGLFACGNWIRIKDRLPEDGQLVIVRYAIEGRIYSDVANYIMKLWWLDSNSNGLELNAISWLPIPEPPEDEVTVDG